MEKKKNVGLIITIIILVVALFGTSGYIVYDKILNKNNNYERCEIENNNTANKNELDKEKNENNNDNTDNSNYLTVDSKELFENLNCITIQIISDNYGDPIYSEDVAVIVREDDLINFVKKFDGRVVEEVSEIGVEFAPKINFIYNDGTRKELLIVNGQERIIMLENKLYKLPYINENLDDEILYIYEQNK